MLFLLLLSCGFSGYPTDQQQNYEFLFGESVKLLHLVIPFGLVADGLVAFPPRKKKHKGLKRQSQALP